MKQLVVSSIKEVIDKIESVTDATGKTMVAPEGVVE